MISVELQSPVKAREFFENKVAFTTGPVELNRMLEQEQNVRVIDVRDKEDYDKGRIPGAYNCPKGTWDHTDMLDRDKTNVIYCYTQTCHLAAAAALEFAERGYSVMEMDGGFAAWKQYGLPVEK